ncbi:hypothetical protein PAHAL_7G302000 [Panicum hallii]|uniref:Uncharacterized protein n=1 Tax=Panicum hallii TaxID=206008 RepID=A0A2T8IE08_9POAL|nr:hypothetical protein PAHAL_7G302000 [Panicum hallii]
MAKNSPPQGPAGARPPTPPDGPPRRPGRGTQLRRRRRRLRLRLPRRRSSEPRVRRGSRERADRACGPGNAERDEVVREDRDGEARGPDLVGGCSLHQAVAAGRRARPGRGVLVRRRVPQGREVADLGVLRVQGARGGGRVQVRAGARHQPRHRLPRHHRRRGAGHEHQHQRPELPLAPVRRRGVARRAQGDREDLRLGAAGSRRRPLPRGAVRPRGGGGGGEVHLLRPQHDRRRARAFPGAQVPAVRRDAESAHGRSAPGEAESREPACRRRSW